MTFDLGHPNICLWPHESVGVFFDAQVVPLKDLAKTLVHVFFWDSCC